MTAEINKSQAGVELKLDLRNIPRLQRNPMESPLVICGTGPLDVAFAARQCEMLIRASLHDTHGACIEGNVGKQD